MSFIWFFIGLLCGFAIMSLFSVRAYNKGQDDIIRNRLEQIRKNN